MRVEILGAGPAGLYLAILLKKTDPGHQVTITERNPPDATFGWGVVFSEETLGALRDADYSTYLEISDTFARWDAIDIRYRGALLRSRGHGFAAIARKRLLAILQQRCRKLGVRLNFQNDVVDVENFGVGADLVVAADGVRSLLREHHAAEFGPTIVPQGGKYAWFGTDLVLDAFTFLFRTTEHGLFQVHSYPFDEDTSTFIVECQEPTWRAAGLDRMSEEDSIAFCEKLFADDLRGHRLLSNRSVWQTFPRVANRTWRHGNVVLLGDAAHTAHFSIGSGTKLAMEDAVALANSFVRHQDVTAALVDYEAQRQPVVARFQRAADDSADYFRRVGHHTTMAPEQFVFNLLTRSGRIGHAELTVRDPVFTGRVDGWFGESELAPPPAFAPFRLGELSLANRIARTGSPRGAGLVYSEFTAVSLAGGGTYALHPTEYALTTAQLTYVYSPSRLGFEIAASVNNFAFTNEPTLNGGLAINGDRNRNEFLVTPRVSYELTPGYQVFVEGWGNRREYDSTFDATPGRFKRSSTGYAIAAGGQVKIGDVVDVSVEVAELTEKKRRVRLHGECRVGDRALLGVQVQNVDGQNAAVSSGALVVGVQDNTGASAAGIARPILQALTSGGRSAAEHFLDGVEAELCAAMLLVGASSLAAEIRGVAVAAPPSSGARFAGASSTGSATR